MKTSLRVLIVGGGIAGASLAGLLEAQGLSPVLVEEERSWSHRGYALALWPLGSRVLHGLGLHAAFLERSQPLELYRILDGRRRLVHEIRMRDHLEEEDMIRMIRREDLLALLAGRLRETSVRFGVTPERVEDGPADVRVTFSDGTQEAFDVVVGCDGIGSWLRRQVAGEVPPKKTGWAGWAWWTDASATDRDTVTEYWAPGRYFETYSTRDLTSVLAAMPTDEMGDDARHPTAAMVREAVGFFGGDVARVLDALDPDEPIYYWDFEDVRTETWQRGRLVLVGDASSALLPSAGVGASCAMESAAVLAEELRRVDGASVSRALAFYAQRRFERVDAMQRESRLVARLMFTRSAALCAVRDTVLRHTSFAEGRLRAMKKLLAEPL